MIKALALRIHITRVSIFCLLVTFFCFGSNHKEGSISETITAPADSTHGLGKQTNAVVLTSVATGHNQRPEFFFSQYRSKRNAVIAGNIVFVSGAIIKYALVQPNISSQDSTIYQYPEMISTMFFSYSLRLVGTPMSCMRASQAAKGYKDAFGQSPCSKLSWFCYFTGLGLSLSSTMIDMSNMFGAGNRKGRISGYLSTGADVMWAGANIVSILYVFNLGKKATALTNGKQVAVAPLFPDPKTQGLSLSVRF
jgi:hypothetical protein